LLLIMMSKLKMNKKKGLLWALSLIAALPASAQIGIGTEKPDSAAILDIRSTNKGVLIPRIELTSDTADLDRQQGQPGGLLVYNARGSLAKGFYFWNGEKWENLESSTIIEPEIDSLHCGHAILEPPVFKKGTEYIGILKVPYSGGNGGKYPAGKCISSTSVNTGLKACLRAGKLEEGRGYLIYDVTGMPKESSPTGATFSIEFLKKKGVAKVGYVESATMTSTYSAGPLIVVLGGAGGYERVVTSFDGKFSVRVWVARATGGTTLDGSLQIRYNNSQQTTIMWNGLTTRPGNIYGTASNQLVLQQQKWSENWGTVSFSMAEQRSFIWTTTDVTDKTVYLLTLMTAFFDSNNPTMSNIFIKIEQVYAS
jgi:hypothetical protein